MLTENYELKLLSQVILKDEPLKYDFKEIFERNEFMRLIRENVTKNEEEKKQ